MDLESKLRDYLWSNPRLYDSYGLHIRRKLLRRTSEDYQFLLEAEKLVGPEATFLQVGANDGLRGDPFREFVVRNLWRGVFVEPHPLAFEQLRENYRSYVEAGRELKFANCAVSAEAGTLKMGRLKPELVARLSRSEKLELSQKTSVDLSLLAKNSSKFFPEKTAEDLKNDIEMVDVPCLSVPEVIAKHLPGERVNFLAIDVEGHELDVLKSLDLNDPALQVIFSEIVNSGEDQAAVLVDLLEGQGFKLRQTERDVMALRGATV